MEEESVRFYFSKQINICWDDCVKSIVVKGEKEVKEAHRIISFLQKPNRKLLCCHLVSEK